MKKPIDLKILGFIHDQQGMATSFRIKESLGLDLGSISRKTRAMEQEGLIFRLVDHTGGARKVGRPQNVFRITPKGKGKL